MRDVSFDDLRWLNLLWLALAAAGIGVLGAWQRRRALRVFASVNLVERIAPRGGWARPLVRLGLVTAALVSLTSAVVGPRWGETDQKVAQRGIDVMVVLDVSRSMLARDIAPSRLERALISLRDDLLPALGGDRVGLIAFAGVPVLKCPLTSDYGFFRLVCDDIGPNSSPRGGTLIGDAIRKARASFDKKIDTHRIILLITDGEDQESYPIDAARTVWDEDRIPIVSVALGDEREGARIPVQAEGGEDYLKYKGETVWSKANFDDLRKIAQVSSLSAFVPVGTRNFDLGRIYRERIVPAISVKQREELLKVEKPSQYHPFALAALVLLLIESFLREGPGRAALDAIRNPFRRAA